MNLTFLQFLFFDAIPAAFVLTILLALLRAFRIVRLPWAILVIAGIIFGAITILALLAKEIH